MRLCICICTCERPVGLARLLKALDQQRLGNLAETALRILIIDNGRSRAAVPVVEAYRATGRFRSPMPGRRPAASPRSATGASRRPPRPARTGSR